MRDNDFDEVRVEGASSVVIQGGTTIDNGLTDGSAIFIGDTSVVSFGEPTNVITGDINCETNLPIGQIRGVIGTQIGLLNCP